MAGVLYAILLMVTGGMHAIHLPSLDVDLSGAHLPGAAHVDLGGHPGSEISLLSLSPITISAFITSFGGFGLIATLGFGMNGVISVVAAVIGALIVAAISHFAFFYLFIAPQASSALTGEIAYVSMGERHLATARSADGTPIPRGTLVQIERLAGTVVIVSPKKEN
jgi:hypothetical protein